MHFKKISLIFSGIVLLIILYSCGGSKKVLVEEKSPTIKQTGIKKNIILAKPFIVDSISNEAFPNVSPDGSYIAYQKKNPDKKWELWLFDTKKDTSFMFFKSAGNVETPRFSKDGTRLVFTSDEEGLNYEENNKSRDIYIISLDTKEVTKITNSDCDNWNPSFANNDTLVVFNSNINDSEQNFYKEKVSFFGYSLISKKIEELFPAIEYKNMSLFSDDYTKIVYSDEENKLVMIDMKNNKKRNITSEGYISGSPNFSNDNTKLFYHNYKNDKYEIWQYFIEKDSSAVIEKNFNNARAPFFGKNKLYFHSNQNGTYDIFEIDLK